MMKYTPILLIMEYVYIRREGDKETIDDRVKGFEGCSNESLIEDYNKQSKCGITGIHAQALYLMAMGHVFFKRFGRSPIYMENNVLGMKEQIKLVGDTFEYVDKKSYKPMMERKIEKHPRREYLEPLIIPGTARSPVISCDATKGLIEISGRMISDSQPQSFEKVAVWLEKFTEMPPKPTTVNMRLEYFNTPASMRVLGFFRQLEIIHKQTNQVVINWYYEEGDDDMVEAGTDYANIIIIPFILISYPE